MPPKRDLVGQDQHKPTHRWQSVSTVFLELYYFCLSSWEENSGRPILRPDCRTVLFRAAHSPPVQPLQLFPIDLFDLVAADFQRRGHLAVVDREGFVGDDEAPHFLDH